jgi:sec-independent protein translocase protein TatA
MFGIGFQEMVLILVVVLIFFGPKRLPDLARNLGKGLAEFKKASEEVKKGIDDAMKEETVKEEDSAMSEAPGAAASLPQDTPELPFDVKVTTTGKPASKE